MTIAETFGLEGTPLNTVPHFMAGMECEIEAVSSKKDFPYFKVTEDGSLRNDGVEFISKPLNRQALTAAFRNLHASIQYTDKQVAFSPRTSTHVHVNCRTLSDDQCRTLVLLYALFEEVFFSMVKAERRGNIHCVPLTETHLPTKYVLSINGMRQSWSKYTAINLVPLGSLGTVEFRHLQGTDDVELVEQWLSVLENLWALSQRVKIDQESLQNKETLYNWFLCIFGEVPQAKALGPALFSIIENSLLDVKLSTIKV